jgi:hypothetical protein
MFSLSSSVSGGGDVRRWARLRPRRNSITMYGVPFSSANSKTVTMFGCWSLADARASR